MVFDSAAIKEVLGNGHVFEKPALLRKLLGEVMGEGELAILALLPDTMITDPNVSSRRSDHHLGTPAQAPAQGASPLLLSDVAQGDVVSHRRSSE